MKIYRGLWSNWEIYLVDNKGNHLPEYQVTHTLRTTEPLANGLVEFHVACRPGQEFSVVAARPDSGSRFDCRVCVSLDGRDARSAFYGERDSTPFKISHVYESLGGTMYTKTMCFETLRKVENGPKVDSLTAMKMGTIKVRLNGGRGTRQSEARMPSQAAPKAQTTVDEKMKKVLGSIIGGNVAGLAVPRHHYDFNSFGHIPEYMVRIKYATSEMLMADDVLPTPDLPQPHLLVNGSSTVGTKRKHHVGCPSAANAPALRSRSSSDTVKGDMDDDDDGIEFIKLVDGPLAKRLNMGNSKRPPATGVSLADSLDSSDDDTFTVAGNDGGGCGLEQRGQSKVKIEAGV